MLRGPEINRRPRHRAGSALTLMGWGAIGLSVLLVGLITVATLKGYY